MFIIFLHMKKNVIFRDPGLECLVSLVLVEEESQTLVLFFVYFMKSFRWCLTTYTSYKTKKYFLHCVY